jgi:hypothetical protein
MVGDLKKDCALFQIPRFFRRGEDAWFTKNVKYLCLKNIETAL